MKLFYLYKMAFIFVMDTYEYEMCKAVFLLPNEHVVFS